MTRCIIHVGTHKTGTTSIQQALDHFEDEEFYYARLLGRSNHSIPAFCLFASDEKRPLKRIMRVAGLEALPQMAITAEEHLSRSIDAAGDRTLIISGEGISTISTAGIEKTKSSTGAFLQGYSHYRLRARPGWLYDKRVSATRSGRQHYAP